MLKQHMNPIIEYGFRPFDNVLKTAIYAEY